MNDDKRTPPRSWSSTTIPHVLRHPARAAAARGLRDGRADSGVDVPQDPARERVDLILLDVMMPGHGRPAGLRRSGRTNRWREIPIILLTAKDDIETRARA